MSQFHSYGIQRSSYHAFSFGMDEMLG
jgi:hypothetical protein